MLLARRLFCALLAVLLAAAPSIGLAATLTVQEVNRNPGLAPTRVAAAAGGDECFNDGRTFLVVRNAHASNTYTVTVNTAKSVDGVPLQNLSISVTATGGAAPERWVGPFPVGSFSTTSNRVTWNYAGTAIAADLTVACVRVP